MNIKRKILIILAVPSLAGVLMFFLVPFVTSVYYAFLNDAFNMDYVGLQNIEDVLTSKYFRLAVRNTVIFTIIAIPAILVVSYSMAYVLTYTMKNNKLLQAILFLPYLLPSVSITMQWKEYCSTVAPIVSLLIIYLWKYTGFNITLFITAFASIQRETLEAAQIDGASSIMLATKVVFPNSVPMLFFVGIISFVNTFKVYRESYLLWGDYPDQSVYMLQNYLNNHFAKLNYQNVAAAADIFFAIIFVIVLIVLRFEKKWSDMVW
ncbi:MAG: sugar ABC transporter permease [Clostridiales bacterium]|nr:sugar ABC transporter permease [Clostridiales bacterium]